jgi:DNA repair exonuclease SbcCD ATPase subunit
MKKLDDVREQIEGIMRGLQRLDALLDVVKELRVALERLEKSRPDETAALLREINTKLDQVLEKLGVFYRRDLGGLPITPQAGFKSARFS